MTFSPQDKSPLGHPVFSKQQLLKLTERQKEAVPLAVPVPGTGNDVESGSVAILTLVNKKHITDQHYIQMN